MKQASEFGNTLNSKVPIAFVGPFPLPITGQTVTTDYLFELCKRAGFVVNKQNIVRGNTRFGIVNTCIRLCRIVRCCFFLFILRFKGASLAYISVDADKGLYVTILISFIARFLNYKIVFHHHAFNYLTRRLRRMVILCKVSGPTSTHISICKTMSDRAANIYPEIRNHFTLTNALTLEPISSNSIASRATGHSFRLGFLSRLSEVKGANVAIQVFEKLKNQFGVNVSIVIAGPSTPDINNQLLEKHVQLYKDGSFKAPGMLLGQEKDEFYRSIDIFLFPTKYVNETQGIVNLEAMAHGVPVVAYGRCCIPSDIGKDGGVVVKVGDNFVDSAVKVILGFIDNPKSHLESRYKALNQFQVLKKQSEDELGKFFDLLNSNS